jgi:hypothetical protein
MHVIREATSGAIENSEWLKELVNLSPAPVTAKGSKVSIENWRPEGTNRKQRRAWISQMRKAKR